MKITKLPNEILYGMLRTYGAFMCRNLGKIDKIQVIFFDCKQVKQEVLGTREGICSEGRKIQGVWRPWKTIIYTGQLITIEREVQKWGQDGVKHEANEERLKELKRS